MSNHFSKSMSGQLQLRKPNQTGNKPFGSAKHALHASSNAFRVKMNIAEFNLLLLGGPYRFSIS